MGLLEFKEFLKDQGYQFKQQIFKLELSECDWYAFKFSSMTARPCEANNDKPGMQICVTPIMTSGSLNNIEMVSIELRGQFNGVWWRMETYSLSIDETVEKLRDIEVRLISAWNSLANTSGVGGNS